MGLSIGTYLMIGQFAFSALSTFSQIGSANASFAAEQQAADANFELNQAEAQRQQVEANRIAAEDKSDIVRRADAELSTIRAQVGDIGAGNTSLIRALVEVGGVEGLDLSRIEANRLGRVGQLQAAKKSGAQVYANTITKARNIQTSTIYGAKLGFIGSGLQIGASAYDRSIREEIAQNKRTDTR
jgi:hypothetical protein